MQLISVNIGTARPSPGGSSGRLTGIYKTPVPGRIRVTGEGLPGDAICSTEHHGGPDQAIYVYGGADYAWWSVELGRSIDPGTFGENLTISELESAALRIGDRFQINNVVLQVTAPRIPCGTFAGRMGDAGFVKRFRAAERPGVYCRVLASGELEAGDRVTLQVATGAGVTVLDVFRDFYEPDLTVPAIRRFLDAPIAVRARRHKEKQLRELPQ